MKAYFMINVKNIHQLIEDTINCFDKNIKPVSFKIIDTINISDEEFESFCNNLLKSHKILYSFIGQMYFENDGTLRCVLVKGENTKQLLCFNSGCTYPRLVGIYDNKLVNFDNN